MANRGKKDTTPPPLLLMSAGGGLTLNPPDHPNVFMPVIQSEPPLFVPDEEGEADSFVGQSFNPTPTQPTTLPQPGTFNMFQPPGSTNADLFAAPPTSASDPFAQVGHNPRPPHPKMETQKSQPLAPPAPSVASTQSGSPFQQFPPQSQTGPTFGSAPSSTPGTPLSGNMFRKQGRPQYAQLPQGTYAHAPPTSNQFPSNPSSPFVPPLAHSSPRPPTAMVPPMSQQSSYNQSQPYYNLTQGQSSTSSFVYQPVQYHWCFSTIVEKKLIWKPFTIRDSLKLEEAFLTGLKHDPDNTIVSTDGGRYDVNVGKRERIAIYWDEDVKQVQRCSWFHKKEGSHRYFPYDEEFSSKLEEEYRNAVENNAWHKRLEFPGGETIVMHNPNVIVHFQASSQPDEWGTVQVGDQMRPKVVKRGVDDFETIEDGESNQIDHLVFVVHGIGAYCDVKFRSIVECVDDFRSISHSLLDSHFKAYKDTGRLNRVEFLPVHWHKFLHSDATGIDERLKAITLPSTARLREFVNDTLLDILFYTSPAYCQLIADTVGREINRIYQLFLSRHPAFKGSVSVAGHSLGSSILFDLLLHQINPNAPKDMTPPPPEVPAEEPVQEEEKKEELKEASPELSLEDLLEKVGLQDKLEVFRQEQMDMEALIMCSEQDLKDLGLPMGPRKKLQGLLAEEQSKKEKKKKDFIKTTEREEAVRKMKEQQEKMVAEVGLSENQNALRGAERSSVQYTPGLAGTGQPFVKYPQLLFSPSALFALGSPIGVFLSVRGVEKMGEEFKFPTCPRFYNVFHPFDPVAYRLEPLVNPAASLIKPFLLPHHKGRKRLHLELKESLARVGADLKHKFMESLKSTWHSIQDFAMAHRSTEESLEEQMDKHVSSAMEELNIQDDKDETSSVASNPEEDVSMGQLNAGRRIDYVLQEKPIESFNDYLFALTSHGCYWESEDTVLMVLKEIYESSGITPQMPGPEGVHKRAGNQPPPPGQSRFQPPPTSTDPAFAQYKPPPVPTMVPPPIRPQAHGMPPSTGQTGSMGAQGPPPPFQPNAPPPMSGFVRK
ncbi:hypothetical protein SNE40_012963 [Patella caerulea]|uniref:DDHD domain-containing protein n=1 Tax=Patella caerulea TaxID=87958 RepID=A0AAN8JL97_PATCE